MFSKKTLCILVAAVLTILSASCKEREEKSLEATDCEVDDVTVSDENTNCFPDESRSSESLKPEEQTASSGSTDTNPDVPEMPFGHGTDGVSGVTDAAEKIAPEAASKYTWSEIYYDLDNAEEITRDSDGTQKSPAESTTGNSADSGIDSKPFGIELPNIYF